MKKLIVIFFLIMSCPLFAGGYEEALAFFNKGDYLESLNSLATTLSEIGQTNPTDEFKLRILAAHNHWELGNYVKAMIHFRRAEEISPGKDLYIDMMLISLEFGHNRDAETYARKILEYDGTNTIAVYGLGEVAFRNGDFTAAKNNFEQCVSEDPAMYTGWNGLGKVLFREKKYSEANTAFSTALALNAGSAELMSNLALTYFHMGKKDKAVEYIDKALSLEPDNSSIRKNHTIIYQDESE